jgi:hypothetical protein
MPIDPRTHYQCFIQVCLSASNSAWILSETDEHNDAIGCIAHISGRSVSISLTRWAEYTLRDDRKLDNEEYIPLPSLPSPHSLTVFEQRLHFFDLLVTRGQGEEGRKVQGEEGRREQGEEVNRGQGEEGKWGKGEEGKLEEGSASLAPCTIERDLRIDRTSTRLVNEGRLEEGLEGD